MDVSGRSTPRQRSLSVAVVGLWHLGSVAAGCLAELGHSVLGVDEDARRVAALQGGKAPLYEPGLDELLVKGIGSGRLRFSTDLSDAIPPADVVFISYDTPITDRDEADVSVVLTAAKRVAPLLRPVSLLVVHSQVPVGTCKMIRQIVRSVNQESACEVAYIPENLRLGQAIERFLHPDMVVVGAEEPRVYEVIEVLLAKIEAPLMRTNLATAEMVKHGINAFLATSISFGNELANLCQTIGADATQVASILHAERRIGPHAPIDPGMGFAGGTLARDVKILRALGRANGYRTHLIDAALEVNDEQNALPLRWLRTIYGTLAGLRVGVFGLTYKVGTSTVRRSAAMEVIRRLGAEGVTVIASDPKADLSEVESLPAFEFTRDPYLAASAGDALLLITPWPEFIALDYERIRADMRRPVALDMQNALDKDRLERLGFVYIGVGRGLPTPVGGS